MANFWGVRFEQNYQMWEFSLNCVIFGQFSFMFGQVLAPFHPYKLDCILDMFTTQINETFIWVSRRLETLSHGELKFHSMEHEACQGYL